MVFQEIKINKTTLVMLLLEWMMINNEIFD